MILNAFLRYDPGSVKGACVKALCLGRGIYMPLTGSGHALSWRLRQLMEYKEILATFLEKN
jgi:hypothetical protein